MLPFVYLTELKQCEGGKSRLLSAVPDCKPAQSAATDYQKETHKNFCERRKLMMSRW